MPVEDLLNAYLLKVRELYARLIEENQQISATDEAALDPSFYEAKSDLMDATQEAFQSLSYALDKKPKLSTREKALAAQIQDKCTQCTLIEKENERIYLTRNNAFEGLKKRIPSGDEIQKLYSSN